MTDPSLSFMVEVSDSVNEVDTATVSITVTDVNDNAPDFGNTGMLYVNVSEGAFVGFSVATVTATDKDSGPNGEFE